MALFASAVVYLTGFYFVGLAIVCFVSPSLVRRFFLGFAGTPGAHYLELSLRLVVGSSFLVHARETLFQTLFTVIGWVLVFTTVGLFAVPWQWHRRFAERSVPHAVRHLPLIGIASFALGGFILFAATRVAVQPGVPRTSLGADAADGQIVFRRYS